MTETLIGSIDQIDATETTGRFELPVSLLAPRFWTNDAEESLFEAWTASFAGVTWATTTRVGKTTMSHMVALVLYQDSWSPTADETAQIMAEIGANPREQEELRRASQQIREGAGRWLADDENPSDAID
jgi:hypothetical protein